jgi:hypothetical protein
MNHRLLQICAQRLGRLPIAKHPGLLFSLEVEGWRDYAFGARAGPSYDAVNIFHELAHASQFGPDQFKARASANGFVFKLPRIWVYDRFCVEPTTNQMTERELDTFAHQLHLMRLAGFKVSDSQFVSYSASLMSWMEDWWHVPGEGEEGRAAWCAQEIRNRHENLRPAEVIDKLVAWLDKTHKRLKRSDAKHRRATHPVERRLTGQGEIYGC